MALLECNDWHAFSLASRFPSVWGFPYQLQGDGRTSHSLLDSLVKLHLRLTFSLPFMAGGTLSFQISFCVQICGSYVGTTGLIMLAVPFVFCDFSWPLHVWGTRDELFYMYFVWALICHCGRTGLRNHNEVQFRSIWIDRSSTDGDMGRTLGKLLL